jgi:hypothetical protein
MNRLFVSAASVAWILSAWAIPVVSAGGLSWDVCTTDSTSGKKTCRSRVPKSARIAIAIGCLVVLILLVILVVCIIRNRRAAAASNDEYNVEASQVDGPATIVDTAYHPRSGPSAVYSGGGSPPEMSGPSFPVAAQLPYNIGNDPSRNHTAPAYRNEFAEPEPPKYSYPFTGYGPNNQNRGFNAPRSAMGASYPRPLLTGNRLKDRLKERPASASSLVVSPRA